MAIRLSGMVSGMDTESLVSALVSSYKLKKDNLVKAQTKLSWKQEKWKTMNTSIYGFYSGKLSSARFSTSYNLKTSTVSNDKYAKVSASSSAVSGTQRLKVNQLAATGYLTGGKITATDKSKVTGSTKLSDIIGNANGSVSVKTSSGTKNIDITEDMNVSQFTTKLKEAGLNANFDEANGRFFISAKESGKDNDFSLIANNDNGLTALKKLGIYTVNDTDKAEYTRLASLVEGSGEYNAELESMYTSINAKDTAKTYADKYNAAQNQLDILAANDTVLVDKDATDKSQALKDAIDALRDKTSHMLDDYSEYYKVKKDADGKEVKDSDGKLVYEYDKEAIEKAGKTEEFNTLSKNKENNEALIKSYDDNSKIISDTEGYVTVGSDGKAVADENNAKVLQEVSDTNSSRQASAKALLDSKIAMAKTAKDDVEDKTVTDAKKPVRVVGQDSEIMLNGAIFTNNSNNFSINGLTIQALNVTADDEEITITTDTDVDGIYDMIKGFLKDYNDLVKSVDVAYNAASSKGYEPLTSDEKDAMTDDEVKKWEEKIKDSLLRKDSTLGSVLDTMKNDMALSFDVNGKRYSLASFGIATLGYFNSPENETGVYHIDGDKDDSKTSANTDKLKAMIASDPDTVISFFSQLSTRLYTDLGNKMAASSTSSAYTIYNDKQMNTQYSEYNTKISEAEDKVTTWEDYYYSKFSAMESALAKMNAQSSSLSGLFG
ncbi:MAG: flagellar filament capping protein FliD [Eubacterium sp.]|nr:flagellar filament capping protein FliD [Eubacterium sp.]